MKNRFVQSTRSRQVAYPPLHERGWWGERQALLVSMSVCVCCCLHVHGMCVCVCVCKHSVPNELKITCGSAFYAASPLPTLFLPGCLPSGSSLPLGSSFAGLWQLSSSWLLSACPLATLCRRSFYYFDYSLSPHSHSGCVLATPSLFLLIGNSTPKEFILFWTCCPCELIVASRHWLQLLPLPFRNTPGHARANPPCLLFASLPHCAPRITSKAAAEVALKPLNILEVI